jgi:resuscitation-promoting factor RpfB
MLRAATIATWGEAEWPAMRTLIYNESGMNPYAINKSSGACSAFQFLPCAKLGAPMSDFNNQIAKGIEYIRARYTTPSRALAYWRCIGWCVNNYGGVQKTATWY